MKTQRRSRRTHWIDALTMMLAMALTCSQLSAAQAPATPASEDEARQQLEAVSAAISDIEQWLQQTRRQRSSEEAALAELDQQLSGLADSMAQNQSRQQALQSGIQALEDDIAPLLAESEQQRAELASALEASYLAGSDSQLKLLLNQQDPAIAQRMLVYFAAFNQERLQQIEHWLNTIGALRQAQSELAASSEQLATTRAELMEQERSLALRQAERQALISSLDAELTARGTELDRLQEDRNALQALIEEINRVIIDIPELEDLTPFVESRGRMPWPVTGELMAGFGQPYGNGQLRRQGILIGADAGTAVRAVHPGRVVFSDWLRGSGNLLVVDHGNGYISLYAHNQQLIKHSGDWVNRGEPLALAGDDAGNGEPGIYFEIRRNSETVNPVDWLE